MNQAKKIYRKIPQVRPETASADSDVATLRRFLPDLDLTLADLPPQTEKLPKNQRKISEKSAAKTTRCVRKSQQNQKPTPSEKNLPKNPAFAPKTTASVGRDPQGRQ